MGESELHNPANVNLIKRLLAALYDWLLVLGLMMVGSVPAVALLGDAIAPGDPLYRLSLVGLAAAFFVGFWTHGGQTLGMRAWRLRLVTGNGEDSLTPVSLRRALLRFAAAWLSLLPAGLGFWWALIDKQRLCWHDRISGTRLIMLPKKQPAASGNTP